MAVKITRIVLARRIGVAAAVCALGAGAVVAPVALANPGDPGIPSWLPFVTERPDTDGDGLYDDDETGVYSTDPFRSDTDGDGSDDGQEVFDGTNPLAPDQDGRSDSDGDGLYDDDETDVYGTNPNNFDTDGDGTGDGSEVENGTNPRASDDITCPYGGQPVGGYCPTGVPQPTGVQPTFVPQPTGLQPTGIQPTGIRPTGIQPTGIASFAPAQHDLPPMEAAAPGATPRA